MQFHTKFCFLYSYLLIDAKLNFARVNIARISISKISIHDWDPLDFSEQAPILQRKLPLQSARTSLLDQFGQLYEARLIFLAHSKMGVMLAGALHKTHPALRPRGVLSALLAKAPSHLPARPYQHL